MMSKLLRVSVVLAIASCARVDDDASVAKPHSHHKKSKAEIIDGAKDERIDQVVKQTKDVATAFDAAHNLTAKRAKHAVKIDEDAKKAVKEGKAAVHDATIKLKIMKSVYDKADKKEKAAIANRHKMEEEYAKAWGKADEAEADHEAALQDAQEKAAEQAEADATSKKDGEAKEVADKASEEATAAERQASSKLSSLGAQSKVLKKKASQLLKHKVVSEKIASAQLRKKAEADKAKIVAHRSQQKAAKEHHAASKAADEAVEANRKARDVSNLKTGVAFRALQDKMTNDAEAEHHKQVNEHMQESAAVLKKAVNEKSSANDDVDDNVNATDGDATDDAQVNEFLAVTNMYRCMHDAPSLTWSDAMAANAKEYIGPLTSMKHSDSYDIEAPAGPAGENLYMHSNAAAPTRAVEAWYSEVNDCQWDKNDGCAEGKDGKVTGHFTVMIWKGAKEMGCAFSDNGKLAICRYRAGDSLSNDTPNMNKNSGNYAKHVFPVTKRESQCQQGSNAPAPAAGDADQATSDPTDSPAEAEVTSCQRKAVTSTIQEAKAGDTKLEVDDTAGFQVGDEILIGSEENIIDAFGSIILRFPLKESHPPGTTIELKGNTMDKAKEIVKEHVKKQLVKTTKEKKAAVDKVAASHAQLKKLASDQAETLAAAQTAKDDAIAKGQKADATKKDHIAKAKDAKAKTKKAHKKVVHSQKTGASAAGAEAAAEKAFDEQSEIVKKKVEQELAMETVGAKMHAAKVKAEITAKKVKDAAKILAAKQAKAQLAAQKEEESRAPVKEAEALRAKAQEELGAADDKEIKAMEEAGSAKHDLHKANRDKAAADKHKDSAAKAHQKSGEDSRKEKTIANHAKLLADAGKQVHANAVANAVKNADGSTDCAK